MNLRRLFFFALFVLLEVSRAFGAQPPLGSVAALFSYTPSRLLADPVRTRVYAADTTSNSVVVIDTTTLQVIATVPIGSNPVDMAISPDGTALYVANGGSTLAAVAVLDLNALTVSATYPLPGTALAIAAGLNGRVYASASSDDESTIYQFDGPTGTMQTTFNQNYYDNDLFQISPDGTTLFVASTGVDYGTLKSFNVSTATPAALQVNSSASDNDSQLVISHNGKYLCLPSGGGNPNTGTYETALFNTADITTFYGSFNNGAYPGPLAFSPDDSLVYQTRYGSDPVLDVFSTQSYLKLEEVSLPSTGSEGYPDTVNSIVADNTGSYLFISESSDDGETTSGQLAVITTGVGTLTPPSILPVITSSLSADATEGTAFTYQITAANTPTSFNATGLPPGLSVNTATGLISGTPTTDDFFEVAISATNASGTATATLELDVEYGTASYVPVITTSSLPGGVVGQSYAAQIAATNSPYIYDAAGLPGGLSIDEDTGVISGVPTTAGVYSVTLQATNDYGTGTTTLSLTTTLAVPVVTSGTAAAGEVGLSFAYQIVATNTPTSYAASGLPAGLSVSAATGLISGTPTAAGTFPVTLSATNTRGTGTAQLSLVVAVMPAPAITSASAAGATVRQSFAYQITASNSPTSYAATGLPAGLGVNTVTGLISGTPTAAGTFSVGLSASNPGGTGSSALALTVSGGPIPVITSVLTANVQQGQAFSYQIAANNAPTSYSAGGLPVGLSLDAATGLISGTPTQAGISSVALGALNSGGTGTATLIVTVISDVPVVAVVATTPTVAVDSGESGEFILSLSAAQTSDVVVSFTIKGTAVNGTDYVLLKTTKKIKAGHTSKPVKVIPQGDLGGASKKTVVLTLEQGTGYTLNATDKAKVSILGL